MIRSRRPQSAMTDATSPVLRRRAVQAWLYAVAALIVVTLVVGGATRLTESGLSITEWKPVTGVLPPMSDLDWQVEFDKYRETPQYRELNVGMSIAEFKVIYWWEWSHRLLARLVGAAFLLPFLWFLWRGWIEPGLRWRLWALFGAGALLGAVGWWMVASGLVGRVSVSPYRLGFHLTLACAIYAGIVWIAQGLSLREPVAAPRRWRTSAIALVVLVLFQIYLGALVAGLDAGLTYNTWPLIDGAFIPSAERLWFETPAWRNLFENTLMTQFNHRMVAYLLWLVAVWHAVDVGRDTDDPNTLLGASAIAVVVTAQAALGVITLIYLAPIGLALTHQLTAIVLLTIAVVHAERLTRRPAELSAATPLLEKS
jgi:cytochrome c oxidase assembly protein subunit 15